MAKVRHTSVFVSHVTRPAGGVLSKHVVLFKAVLGKMPAKRGSKLQDQWVHHAFFGSLTHSGESSKNQAGQSSRHQPKCYGAFRVLPQGLELFCQVAMVVSATCFGTGAAVGKMAASGGLSLPASQSKDSGLHLKH